MKSEKNISNFYSAINKSGLGSVLRMFGEFKSSQYDMRKASRIVSPNLRYLIEIFVLGEKFDPKKLEKILGMKIMRELKKFELVAPEGKSHYRLTCKLSAFSEGYFFMPNDRIVTSFAYFSKEALALDLRQKEGAENILVMFSAFGLEAVLAKLNNQNAKITCHCFHCYSKLLDFNLLLNSTPAKIIDSFETLGTEKFDMIVSTPPYVPEVEPVPVFDYNFGQDGMNGLRESLSVASMVLQGNGKLFLVGGYNGMLSSYESGLKKIIASNGLEGNVFLTSKYDFSNGVGASVFNMAMLFLAEVRNKKEFKKLAKETLLFSKRHGFDSTVLFFATLERKKKDGHLALFDFSDDYLANWLL